MPRKLLLLLALYPIYQVWDVTQLFLDDGLTYHLVIELVVTGLFAWLIIHVWRERIRVERDLDELKSTSVATARAMAERDAAHRAATRNFVETIRAQFKAWQLTPSESEVALLLVKGLSLEQIAAVRDTKPKTVRQHAANVYAKARVEGRHQLAAYFLEDLMADSIEAPAGEGSGAATAEPSLSVSDAGMELGANRKLG